MVVCKFCETDERSAAIINDCHAVIEPASAGLLAQPGVFSAGRRGRAFAILVAALTTAYTPDASPHVPPRPWKEADAS
jgi:hypothetical protein